MALRDLLATGSPDIEAIEAHLDALSHEQRLEEVRALGRREQSRLFDAAAGYKPLSLDHFVPEGREPLSEVVHHGKNSLPAFSRFAKVFCRPDRDAEGELWGYNRNPPLVETTVGPGYFVAYAHGDGEVLIDYLRLPPDKPTSWPPILSNAARLSRFVYHGTQDVLRHVSRHVAIGRATKKSRRAAATGRPGERHGEAKATRVDFEPMPNWFVLCREDPVA